MNEERINRLIASMPTSRGRLIVPRGGDLVSLPFADLALQVAGVQRQLAALGLRRGEIVGICAANSVDWVVLDLACIAMGLVTAPFDINSRYDAKDLFDTYGLARLFSDRDQLLGSPRSHAMEEVTQWGAAIDRDVAVDPAVRYAPRDVLSWKFTSGSTGVPKVLAARVESIDDSMALVQDLFSHGPSDSLFVFLPLSLLQQRYWIYSGILHHHDVVLTRYEFAIAALRASRPTVVMGVPGFFDALKTFYEQWANAQPAEAPSLAAFMGGRIRYLWTGSAPASRSTLDFYRSAGLAIHEGYGLNETCIVAKNHPGGHRHGSVGQVVRHKRVSFDEAGQILVHSRFPINDRYAFCAPGESESCFLGDGLVATGDIGHLDEDGFLFITGRVKELIALSSGKKVHPRLVEERLAASPLIQCALVHGTGRPHLIAVVVPHERHVSSTDLEHEVLRLSGTAAPEERVRQIVLADEPFTRENGLLTSQYKLRRDAIARRYQREIDACYAA